MLLVCFFFSSRRRHTRLVSDWSSDVCSSDLSAASRLDARAVALDRVKAARRAVAGEEHDASATERFGERSEERRVGKEGRSGWAPYHKKKQKNEEFPRERTWKHRE